MTAFAWKAGAWKAGGTVIRLAGLVGLVLAGQAAGGLAAEPYKFDADYRVSLSGVPIGKAHLTGTFNGPRYRIDGYGSLTGIAGAFYDYKASASSAGRLSRDAPLPNAFSVNATDGEKTATVRMTMSKGRVNRLQLSPRPSKHWLQHPFRVRVTEAHKRGTLDPMSALIVTGADGLDARACNRTVPIFNGRERFDVQLRYRSIRTVSDRTVPGGRVLVCGAKYRAVAGHRSDKDEVKQAEKVDIELQLSPVEGSDLLVPYRVHIPTPLGPAVIQASGLTSKGALSKRSALLASAPAGHADADPVTTGSIRTGRELPER